MLPSQPFPPRKNLFTFSVTLCRGFSMETFRTHEYGIPLVRGAHLEGPHVFGFLICAFVSELWPQTWGTSIQGEMNNWNPWLMLKCYFTENCVSLSHYRCLSYRVLKFLFGNLCFLLIQYGSHGFPHVHQPNYQHSTPTFHIQYNAPCYTNPTQPSYGATVPPSAFYGMLALLVFY